MHRYFPCALALTIGLASCATLGQQDWHTYLDGGRTFYVAYCVAQPKAEYCTADAQKKAADAYKAADKAITAYENGTDDLAAVQKAVKAAFKLFGDFKG